MLICMQLGKLSYTCEDMNFINSLFVVEEKICQYCGNSKCCVQKAHMSTHMSSVIVHLLSVWNG